MVAYIVGMITGCICMVSALYYFVKLGTFDATLGYGVAALGGVVFLLSAVLMVVASLRCAGRAAEAAPRQEPEPKAGKKTGVNELDFEPEDLTLEPPSGGDQVSL